MKWKCIEYQDGSNPYICKTDTEFNRIKRKYGKRMYHMKDHFYMVREESFSKWQLIDYTDVWGNAKDGWEVNDWDIVEKEIVISDYATDKEIINYLNAIGYLGNNDMRRIAVENLGDFIEIYQRKYMKPLYSLRRAM